MSESDDNDFEEDGVTMQSGFNGPIILRANEDAESLLIASNSEEEVKLNMSLGTDSRRRPRSPAAESEANQARSHHSQLLRLFLLPTGSSQRNTATSMQRMLSQQNAVVTPVMDNRYSHISKNDEGNIGGTLSNLDQQDGSAIIAFTDVLNEDISEAELRVTNHSPPVQVEDDDELNGVTIASRSNSDQRNKTASWGMKKTQDVACSSYYNVNLSTEKARRRQSSLGLRSQMNAAGEMSKTDSYMTMRSGEP